MRKKMRMNSPSQMLHYSGKTIQNKHNYHLENYRAYSIGTFRAKEVFLKHIQNVQKYRGFKANVLLRVCPLTKLVRV